METRTDDYQAEIVTDAVQGKRPASFLLYEEYSQVGIDETIKLRRETYREASAHAKEELAEEVDMEVENFHVWLEEVKRLEPFAAHYFSVSLKSLLLGLPVGEQVASLFDIVLRRLNLQSER